MSDNIKVRHELKLQIKKFLSLSLILGHLVWPFVPTKAGICDLGNLVTGGHKQLWWSTDVSRISVSIRILQPHGNMAAGDL